MEVVPFYLILVRLLVPFSILRWPLFGILAATLVDMYDWKFVNVPSALDLAFYQNWDKAMDLYYWLFAIVVVFRWKDILARNVAFALFSIRALGLALFYLTHERVMLFFFPNVFENFFIFYVAFVHFSKNWKLTTSWKLTAGILLSLVIPKLVHEYFMHYLVTQPWEVYNVGAWFGTSGILQEYVNYAVWGTIFYITPFIILLCLIRQPSSPALPARGHSVHEVF